MPPVKAPTGLAGLRQPFPAEAVSQISMHGTTLDYVGHAYITERLLDVDPEWTWEPLGVDPTGEPVISTQNGEASLWIKLTVCGVSRIGVGIEKDTSNELCKKLVSDAIRNAAMRFGAALDLWKKSAPSTPKPVAQTRASAKSSEGSKAVPATGEGNAYDAYLDVLANPDGWFDNRKDKKNPKAPDFKAKTTNPYWGEADSYNGQPSPLALWLRDAPEGFMEALEAGATAIEPQGEVVRAKTVAKATEALNASIFDEDEPF